MSPLLARQGSLIPAWGTGPAADIETTSAPCFPYRFVAVFRLQNHLAPSQRGCSILSGVLLLFIPFPRRHQALRIMSPSLQQPNDCLPHLDPYPALTGPRIRPQVDNTFRHPRLRGLLETALAGQIQVGNQWVKGGVACCWPRMTRWGVY